MEGISTSKDYQYGDETKKNGNCSIPAEDGLPVQSVGAWAKDKNHYLRNYIEATKAVRARYLPPKGPGGAAFIDLFAGPGKKRVRETGEVIDGSPLIALLHEGAPFSKVVACDIEVENAASLRERFRPFGSRGEVIEGDCNKELERILKHVPLSGLNLALIDPFGLRTLKFSTIARLGAFQRMDLIIHFPTGDIKRNLAQSKKTAAWLDEALGTPTWRGRQRDETDVNALVEVLVSQLQKLGYSGTRFCAPSIKNNVRVPLYHLVFASKHDRGDKIWASILRKDPSGQSSFPLDL